MVLNNKIVPEMPDDSEPSLSTNNNEVILVTDSDSDNDEVNHNGYEPLPLTPPDDANEIDDSDSESDNDSGLGSAGQQSHNDSFPAIVRIESQLTQEVWSEPTPSAVDIEMDSNKVDQVKQAMANITLPSSSIPDWANNIPEDQWKQHLFDKLQDLQRHSK